MEPLQQRLAEQNKQRQALKKRWMKELKRVSEAVINLNKAKQMYHERNKDYERCVEAVRIAEQAAELGAAGEGKVDKRKRLEEEALAKTMEYKTEYMKCVKEANSRHRRVYELKAEVLSKIREIVLQCDKTMKEVTVAYCQMQHKLTSPIPIQFQALCEKARLYEPGSQFMDYAKTMLQQGDAADQSGGDPFRVELPGGDAAGKADEVGQFFARHHTSASGGGVGQRKSVDFGGGGEEGTYKFKGEKPAMAWATPISDTDSIESRDSCKSADGSPPASPMMRHASAQQSDEVDDARAALEQVGSDGAAGTGGLAGGGLGAEMRKEKESLAAQSHKFRKLKTPTRCKECDSYVFSGGYMCQDCGLSAHRKCLEGLAINCGHKRLPRRMVTFGVDIGQHLLDTGTHIPPILSKCIHEIDKRGLTVRGIYRMSGVKHRVAKICQAFESAPDLVELSEVQPNIIANVLKKYLSDLPEPLITVVLYPDFVEVAKTFPSKSASSSSGVMTGGGGGDGGSEPEPEDEETEAAVIQQLSEQTRRLPRIHLRTLAFLMHHLQRVSKESDSNGMTANNLARVFCPTLMRTPDAASESLTLQASLFDTDHQTRVVELLILHAEAIFGPPETVLPKDYTVAASSRTSMSSRSASIAVTEHHSVHRSSKIKHHKESSASVIGIMHGGGGGSGGGAADYLSGGGGAADDFPNLPGQTTYECNEDLDEDDEDGNDDAEAIPACWFPDESAKTKKSPLMRGKGGVPSTVIVQASLKNFSGLEGVTPERLSTQDSLEAGQKLAKQTSQDVTAAAAAAAAANTSAPSGATVVFRKSIPQEGPTSGSAPTMVSSSSRTHRASDAIASRVSRGGVKKKHSLDEDYLMPAHPPLTERLSDSPAYSSSGQTSASLLQPDGGNGGTSSKKVSTSSSEAATTSTSSARSSSISDENPPPLPPSSSVKPPAPQPPSHQQSSTTISVAVSEKKKFLTSTNSAAAIISSSSSSSSGGADGSTSSSSAFRMSSISNLEENRVKIQVPGGLSNAAASSNSTTRQTILKQSSVDKGE